MTDQQKIDYVQRILDLNFVKYFTAKEIYKPSWSLPPEEILENIIPTIMVTEYARGIMGAEFEERDLYFRLSSTYRPKEQNDKAGSNDTSMHFVNNAVDIHVIVRKPSRLYSLKSMTKRLYELLTGGYIVSYILEDRIERTVTPDKTGVGIYEWGVHLDTRGLIKRPSPKRWDNRVVNLNGDHFRRNNEQN